jgi:sugar/nucleoside kinase (ribokinase family)
MFDILVAGEINPDLILAGDVEPQFGQVEKLLESAKLTIGSSSAIFACGAARLGLKVAFAGICGDDAFGRFMIEEMQKRNVDTSPVVVRADGQTGVTVILNRETDRAIFTHPGLMAALTAGHVTDDWLSRSRHLHIASYYLQTGLQPDLPELFLRAHARGLTTSLDTNFDPSGRWQGMAGLLPHTDIFLPNEAEALSVAHASEAETAARRLAEQAGLVVVKLGERGALACRDNVVTRAGPLVVNIMDSIGAGDTFDAGFLYGTLNDLPLETSLRIGCVCGALSMQKAGGTDGQPTLGEVMPHVA